MSMPAEPIALQQGLAPFFWGVDVGGTNIKIGLVDDSGQTLAYQSIPTEVQLGPQGAVDRIATFISTQEERIGKHAAGEIRGVGLGTPGSMDLPKGILVEPPNLPGWWYFPIRDALASATGREVVFVNDANAAAYGEFWLGAGRDHDSMILLTLGTGVGGGVIVDDELVNGVNSFGSECGHIIVDPSPTARLCAWGGGRGHLEAYASASAVVRRTLDRLRNPAGRVAPSLLDALGAGDGKGLTAKKIYEAALQGDSVALEIIDETAWWLGVGITTLVATLDPGLVVLGGAMDFGGASSPIGQRFLEGIREEFRRRAFANVVAGTTIQFASLGGRAGHLGAAGYARKILSRRGATQKTP